LSAPLELFHELGYPEIAMPVRKIPKNYRNVTGLIATDKSDEMTGYESRLEHNCQKLITFNPNVAGYEEQPVTISYTDKSGKERKYTPDILIHYRKDVNPVNSWRPLLGEVKWRSDLFKNWGELKPKIKAGQQYATEQGYDFVLMTEREINTPYVQNAIFLLEFRDHPFNEEDSQRLLSALNSLGETDVQTLMLSLTDDDCRKAELLPILWHLVANFEITANLEIPLNMRSRLSPKCRDEEMNHEYIHERRAGHARHLRWRALRYYPPFEP
jgi:hypothetical protein